jgi:AmmeMemoRadiSam system protein B
MRSGPPLLAAAIVFLSFGACQKPSRPYSTWESAGEKPEPAPVPAPEAGLPSNSFPIGGTVSHHLLAYSFIDGYFRALAAARDVRVFIILSPLHFNRGYERISITDRSWKTASGIVESDAGLAGSLARKLGVSLDPMAFEGEHGVSTLIPFIARYFPKARVVAIAYEGEPPVDVAAADVLANLILPLFAGRGVEKYFLLVSADFSHHGNRTATEKKDALSLRFFERPDRSSWVVVSCDNGPGMYVLGTLAQERGCGAAVLHHATSLEIAPALADPANITSYFFSFIYRSGT